MKKVALFGVLAAACGGAESGLAFAPESTCTVVDGLCTDLILPDIPEAEHLRTDGTHTVFASAGAIVVLSMDEGTMLVIESETPSGWSTPSVSDGRVAAKHMLPDGTVEYAVFSVARDRLGAIHVEDASSDPEEFAVMPLELVGDYLAYFEPAVDEDWMLVVAEIVDRGDGSSFRRVEIGIGTVWSEVTIDHDGRVLCVLSSDGSGWSKRALDLFVPNWELDVPWSGPPTSIVTVDEYLQVSRPQMSGDLILYEITGISPYGSAIATAILVTDLDPDGYDWLLDAQAVWGHEIVLGSLDLSEELIGWLDGRLDAERPAIALRPYSVEACRHLAIEEDYAIYPPPGGQITEFQIVGNEVHWLLAESKGMSLYRTAVVE